MPAPWLAPCLVVLRDQVDVTGRGRDRSMDGWIGDLAHQDRPSDHNAKRTRPFLDMVCAVDITDDDTAPGFDATALVETLRTGPDDRWKYLIHRGRITRAYPHPGTIPRQWAPYTGTNGHFAHAHISCWDDIRSQQVRPWPLLLPHHLEDLDMTEAELRKIITEEMLKVLKSEGVSGVAINVAAALRSEGVSTGVARLVTALIRP